MSDAGVERRIARPPEWDRLELSVRRLLDDYDRVRRRARAAEQRAESLEATLRQVTDGVLDPAQMSRRIQILEAENRDLQERLAQARERVGRLVDRLRFLEGER